MKMKRWMCILVVLSLLLAGCGAVSKSESYDDSYYMTEMPTMEAAMAPDKGIVQNSSMNSASELPDSRKWVITMHMNVETEDMDALLKAINDRLGTMKGYAENLDISNGSSYGNRSYRSASMTVRVPAEYVDDFAAQLSGVSNVTSSSKSMEDVTLSYADTETRMKALQAEEARLLELMEQAETMYDLLEIESRLTDVRYELESVASRLRILANLVDYATIRISISEVREYTPAPERTMWQRITDGFLENLGDIGSFFEELIVWLLSNLPSLVLLAAVIVLIVWVVRRSSRKRREKAMAEYYKRMQAEQNPQGNE